MAGGTLGSHEKINDGSGHEVDKSQMAKCCTGMSLLELWNGHFIHPKDQLGSLEGEGLSELKEPVGFFRVFGWFLGPQND